MRISVVIPCYNAEAYIEQTIRSVVAQSYPAMEIIVADDGSTDRTVERVRGCGAEIVFLEGEHGGAARARNRGAALARGDALMFLDADDVLGPDVLRHLAEALRGAPQGIAFCDWRRLERVGGRWVQRPASCAPRVPGDDVLGSWLSGWYHPPCSVLWSRAAYELSGGWDESLPGNPNDDGDIAMRAIARGAPVIITRKGSAFYRKHESGAASLSGRRFTEQGLTARRDVLVRLAGVLREAGRLERYQAHLAAAFDQIAHDCGGNAPRLALECELLALQYGGPPWRRRAWSSQRRVRTRAADVLLLLADPQAVVRRRREKRALTEVRYGLGNRDPGSSVPGGGGATIPREAAP